MEKLLLEIFNQWANAADVIEPMALLASISGFLLHALEFACGIWIGLTGAMIYSFTISIKIIHEHFTRPALILPSDEEFNALVSQWLAPQLQQLQQVLAENLLHNQRHRLFQIPELKPVFKQPLLPHRNA
jgi:hypothetical protein